METDRKTDRQNDRKRNESKSEFVQGSVGGIFFPGLKLWSYFSFERQNVFIIYQQHNTRMSVLSTQRTFRLICVRVRGKRNVIIDLHSDSFPRVSYLLRYS